MKIPVEIRYDGGTNEISDHLEYFAKVQDHLADQMIFSCSRLHKGVNVIYTVYYERDTDEEGDGNMYWYYNVEGHRQKDVAMCILLDGILEDGLSDEEAIDSLSGLLNEGIEKLSDNPVWFKEERKKVK